MTRQCCVYIYTSIVVITPGVSQQASSPIGYGRKFSSRMHAVGVLINKPKRTLQLLFARGIIKQ